MTTTARRRRIADAAGAALMLMALLGGPPIALSVLIGDPLPGHWPSWHEISHALSAPVSDHTVLYVFAAVTWLAWAHLLACVAVEMLRQLRGVTVTLPLGGPNRRLAQYLVATLLASVSAGSSVGLTPALAAAPTVTAMRTPAPLSPAMTAARSTVPAEQLAAAAGGGGVAAAVVPHDRPAAAPLYKEYVVAPPHGRHHDNLWDIAARHLGDPMRWKEIFALNDGRRMPDGQHLTRASLIRPGWVLRMPVDATGLPTLAAPAQGTPTPVPDQRRIDPRHPAAGPTAITPPQSVTEPAPAQQAPAPELPVAPVTPTAHNTSPSAERPPPPVPLHNPHRNDPAVPVGAGLGVAAIGLLAALERRRRVAARRRKPGTRLALPEPALQQAELSLRHRAKEARAVSDTVRLAVTLAAQLDPRPTVRAVVHHPDGTVELRLDQPTPGPAPFDAAGDAAWILRPEQHGYLLAVTDREDPVPVLLPVGARDDGAAVYVNIEADGVLHIAGEQATVTALLAGAARSLAGSPWAEQTQMIVPSRFARAAEGLERIDVLTDPPQLLDYVTAYAERVAATLPAEATVASARRDGTTEALGVIVLVGFTADELPDQILAAAGDTSRPVVAVLSSADGDLSDNGWRLDGDVLHVPGLEPITGPVRMDIDELAVTSALLSHAAEPGEAAPDDPQLAALAEDAPPDPHEPGPDDIEVKLLGPVELHAPGKPKRASVRELVLYLALHRRPRPDTVIYARLFPDSEFSRDVIRSRMTEARRVLAGAIVHVDHTWGVSELVSTDWQRFQALARGDLDQQRAALRLVRGLPFEGYDGEWVHAEGHDRQIEAAIVDLALAVAERALDDGDDRLATEAVEAGLRAAPYEERLYRLGMRAAAARGATSEVRGYMRALKRLLDVDLEPEDQIQPETEHLYRRLVASEQRVG